MYIDLKMMWVSQFAIIVQKTLDKADVHFAEQERIEDELERMEDLLRIETNEDSIEA